MSSSLRSKISILLALIVVLSMSLALFVSAKSRVQATGQTDWPMFGFDAQHTRYNPNETALNTSNVSGLTLDWSFTAGSYIYSSSPTVVNGIVYVGSWDKKLYALDANTGTLKWSYATGHFIYSSPAVVNGIVYVGSLDHNLYALDANTGTLKWSYATAGMIENSSPTVVNGLVYVGSDDGKLYALDANLGTLKWSYTTGKSITSSSPAVANGIVYIGSDDNKLYALDANTGTLKWSYTTGGSLFSPTVSNGRVYVRSDDGKLYALDATIGTLKWSSTILSDSLSLAVANGVIYVSSYSPDNKLYALDANTGMVKWSSVSIGIFQYSSPAIANGVVYIGSENYYLYALDANTGTVLWSYLTGYSILSSPAVVNGIVYVGSDDYKLYAFSLPGVTPTPSPSLSVNVTVSTPGGHFISSYSQDNAALPLHIHVAYSDGTPVAGAKVHLSNPNGFLAVFNPVTDSNGNLDAPLPLPPSSLSPQPLTVGDFVSEVIATFNGKDYSSGSLTLYHADQVGYQHGTTTPDEANNYPWKLLYYYATKPSLPCPGIDLRVKGICYALKVIDMYAKEAQANAAYSPKALDSWTVQVYKYSAPTMTPVYLYYESNNRSGSNIYQYAQWTEDITQVQPFLNQQAMIRTALIATFDSPVTVLAVSPTGQRAGFDPTVHNFVFDFPVAISNAGDEPYELVIPNPVQGQYTYQVTGTGNGTYTMTVQNLDSAGNGNPVTTISGVAAPGITDTYLLTYSASPGQPVVVVREIAIDIRPGQDPPAINPGSNGVTTVAILSTPTFNATTVDPKSVKFGPNGVSPVHTSIQDVNGDGIPDLVLQFSTLQIGITAGNTQACLTGNTTSGLGFMGCDTIQTVPN